MFFSDEWIKVEISCERVEINTIHFNVTKETEVKE